MCIGCRMTKMLLDECPDPEEAGDQLTRALVVFYLSADAHPDEIVSNVMDKIEDLTGPQFTLH